MAKESVDQLVERGRTLLKSGDGPGALAAFKQVTAMDPAHAQAWYCMGTIYGQMEDYEHAVQCYGASAKNTPRERLALPLFNMGNAFQAWGKIDKAIDAFKLTVEADPEFADGWINYGRLLDDTGRHAGAIAAYDEALKHAPENVMALGNRGNSLRALKRFTEAKESYEKALALDPRDIASLVGRAVCVGEMGRPEKALAFIDQVLSKVTEPALIAERAMMLAKLERNDEALQWLDKAIKAGIRFPAAWNNRGELLARLNRPVDAIRSFDQALKENPRYAPALFGKARVQCNAGQYREARVTIQAYFDCSDASDGLTEAAKATVAICDAELAKSN